MSTIGMKQQVASRVTAKDTIQPKIVLNIFNRKFWVSMLKMEQGAVIVAGRVVIVSKYPVVVMHLGAGSGQK